MKVFISYSVDDKALVQEFAKDIKPHVEQVYWWEESKELGEDAWKSISEWIDQADLVLAIITDHAVSRAMSVGNEIGHAKARGIKIIPLVAPGINSNQLGCLQGVTYQRIDAHDSRPAADAITKEINQIKQRKQVKVLKIEEGSGFGSFLVVAGLVALVIWASRE